MTKKVKTKRSVDNMIIYTDPSFPLKGDNIFTTARLYKNWQQFEKFNEGMKALVVVPKSSFPKQSIKKLIKR